jgi:hypothetical protein
MPAIRSHYEQDEIRRRIGWPPCSFRTADREGRAPSPSKLGRPRPQFPRKQKDMKHAKINRNGIIRSMEVARQRSDQLHSRRHAVCRRD